MSKNGKTATAKDVAKLLRALEAVGGLVGTKEAAEILDVERPRIGRWRRAGLLPEPLPNGVSATPLWPRTQIEGVREERESRRREPAEV